ncbi:MAG: endonuclease/exonuclease/phosphatase family protein [Pseudomonadota bacterium]
MKFLIACFLALSFTALGCRPSEGGDTEVAAPAAVTIMTFNVENLFDTEDDPGKDDHAYFPRSAKNDAEHIAKCEPIEVERWKWECLELNWDESALTFKLEQLAKSILQVNDGLGPDIIALQEVENLRVLTRLATEYLAIAGYTEIVLIEGRDIRGIDVAFLSRLPLVGEPTLHPFNVSEYPDRENDTRGVLEATFELPDGSAITGFAVHFPAPFHPIEMRELAYDHLNSLRANVPDDQLVFAAGDFNTPQREMTNTTIMDDRVRPYWRVAHELGCEGCRGTNYWRTGNSWSFLDMILVSRTDAPSWDLQVGQTYIANQYPDQMNADGTVKRFNLTEREGVSDHLPLVVTLMADRP